MCKCAVCYLNVVTINLKSRGVGAVAAVIELAIIKDRAVFVIVAVFS
jgi:hypothetical protein